MAAYNWQLTPVEFRTDACAERADRWEL